MATLRGAPAHAIAPGSRRGWPCHFPLTRRCHASRLCWRPRRVGNAGRSGTPRIGISNVAPGLRGCGKCHLRWRSPQGTHIVAVGKGARLAPAAHGSRAPNFPDPEEVAFPHVARHTAGGAATGIEPYRVGAAGGRIFRGSCPRLFCRSPAGTICPPRRGVFSQPLEPGMCRPKGRRYVQIGMVPRGFGRWFCLPFAPLHCKVDKLLHSQ